MKKVNFQKIAREVISLEIKSLIKLKSSINISFSKAVQSILECKNGKVIVSGVGKSGIIGKKISSTLASVGVPSFFVDASSCSHGDLGQIGSNDVLIIISFSGETSELKNIIQYANRNKKITLIGIVSKKNSLLYKASDIKLLIPEVKEAGPGNIVPTSSTIIQLAIGDALALTISKLKGHKIKDYAEIHPSGSIGKSLYMNVEELMIKTNLPLCPEETELQKVLTIMEESALGSAFITTKRKLKGIITDGDLRRYFKNDNIMNTKAKNIMTKNPKYVYKDSKVYEAFDKMIFNKINILPVIDSEGVVGAIQLYNIN